MKTKQAIMLGLAYFSTTVGAGFASGQEALQYYISYGTWGIVGVFITFIIVPPAAMIILQYGTYLRAQSHNEVFNEMMGPWLSKVFDWFLIFAQFAIAFVMLAGAGSNLDQAFGIPTWIGSVIMVILCIAFGLLDTERVTIVLGVLTPLMVILLVGASIWSIVQGPGDYQEVETYAMETINQPLPNWFLSTVNYIGLGLFSSVAMAFLIGGTVWDNRVAGWGGLFGGVLFAGIMVLLVFGLMFRAEDIAHTPLPTLALFNQIHPAIGFVAAVMTYLMIFSTALGQLYSLGKRVAAKKPKRFPVYFISICAVAFGLSFLDFVEMVGFIFPIVGWMGLALVVVLFAAFIYQGRNNFGHEYRRRDHVRSLILKTMDPKGRLSDDILKKVDEELDDSPVETRFVRHDLIQDVKREKGLPTVTISETSPLDPSIDEAADGNTSVSTNGPK